MRFRTWLLKGSAKIVVDCDADVPEHAKAEALRKEPEARWVHTAPLVEA